MKILIERNFNDIDTIFDTEASEDGSITLEDANRLYQSSFGCQLPTRQTLELKRSLKRRRNLKGLTREEFVSIALSLLSSRFAPEVIQFLYGNGQNSFGEALFGKISSRLASRINDSKGLNSLTRIARVIGMGSSALIDKVAEMKQHETSLLRRISMMKKRETKVIEANQKAVSRFERIIEENDQTITQLKTTNDELKEKYRSELQKQESDMESQIKSKDKRIAELTSKCEEGEKERQDLYEHLRVNKSTIQDYDKQLRVLKRKLKVLEEKNDRVSRVERKQSIAVQNLKEVLAEREEELRAKENQRAVLLERVETLKIDLANKGEEIRHSRAESLADQFRDVDGDDVYPSDAVTLGGNNEKQANKASAEKSEVITDHSRPPRKRAETKSPRDNHKVVLADRAKPAGNKNGFQALKSFSEAELKANIPIELEVEEEGPGKGKVIEIDEKEPLDEVRFPNIKMLSNDVNEAEEDPEKLKNTISELQRELGQLKVKMAKLLRRAEEAEIKLEETTPAPDGVAVLEVLARDIAKSRRSGKQNGEA
eukprot:CAMPEP_0167745894 /NCGR_PEP_ID=MMETSP0110_2-20121227/3403_1 /TAXON_ID=629695 /ORGANISM="Gymnochlora sp., Strain CCMP2014" /LENGTH=541 /DNA_ID=CAMNT_0007630583 /DNA_START=120 /DNA_END=1746 /DNA_ORIENTATION=+